MSEASIVDPHCELAAWPQWTLKPRGESGLRQWLLSERKRLASAVPGGQDPSRFTHAQAIRTIGEIIRELDEEHPKPA